MIKTIRFRIYPNKTQINHIDNILELLRKIWNLYVSYNKINIKAYHKGIVNKPIIHWTAFNTLINHNLINNNPWIKDCPSKARKDILHCANNAFKRFFRGLSNFPNFKSQNTPVRNIYFIADGVRFESLHRIWIPIIHSVRFYDKGYSVSKTFHNSLQIISGKIIKDRYNRYFIALIVNEQVPECSENMYLTKGLGIKLGLYKYATIFDGYRIQTISNPWFVDNSKILKYFEKIKTLQRIITRKIKIHMSLTNCNKYEANHSRNVEKLWNKIRNYYKRISDYMRDFIKKLCNKLLTEFRPKYITIETPEVVASLRSSTNNDNFFIINSRWYLFAEYLMRMGRFYSCEVRFTTKAFKPSKIYTPNAYKYTANEISAISLFYTKKYTIIEYLG